MARPLTSGPIAGHLIRLTIPSIAGFLAITAFNLTDTYFVSRLGTDPLAAMGFTFPIVMVVGALASGVAMGAGSILARAFGAGDDEGVKRAATHGLLLSLTLTALVGAIGLLTMRPLFLAMGASEEVLPLVKNYMTIWYAGSIVVMTPPVGDSNLRATGDMIRPSIVMIICAVGNVVLDPLLIFGAGPIPAMGISGAALATVISRGFGMAATLTFNIRAGLIDKNLETIRRIWSTWLRILYIGVPTALTQLMPSLLRAVLTAMAAAAAGTVGVAAVAAGGRVESVPLMVAWAFNFSILTLIAQNYGAGRADRVETVRRSVLTISLAYGALLAAGIWFSAPSLAGIFSDDAEVIRLSTIYLRAAFLSSFGVLILTWTSVTLNAVGRPMRSLALNAAATGLLMIPGAYIGRLAVPDEPFIGMMAGLACANVLSGAAAWFVGKRRLLSD